MAIKNGFGISSYSVAMDRGYEGAPASGNMPEARTVRNPDLAQISTVTVGGTATDGTYSFDIEDPLRGVVTTIEQVRSTTPATNTDLAAAMVATINTTEALLNVCTAANVLGVITLTFLHNGVEYTVDNEAAPAPGTLVAADTQSAGGSAIPMGRFCTLGAAEDGVATIALPTTSDAAAAFAGVVMRSIAHTTNSGSEASGANDTIPVGGLAALAYDGAVLMKNVAASAASPHGVVYAVVDTAGGQELGQASATALGTVAKVVTATPTAANSTVYALTIAFDDNEEFFQVITSDGSATATEICDAFRTAIALNPALVGRITTSGTATLILTGDVAGDNFEVTSSGEGAWASITDTVEADANTIALDRKQAYWVEDTAAGAIGPVMVRM